MNTPRWIEYKGSEKQIEELKNNPNGYIVRDDLGVLSGRIRVAFDLDGVDILPFEYLICQPHPYADLIKIWADTGCPVWYRHKLVIASGECGPFHLPFSYPDICEYSLTPFED